MGTYLPFKVDLSGKTAVVTGGGGVLCSGFAKALAACGAGVAVLSRRADSYGPVVEEILAEGGKALGVSADVTDKKSLLAARDEIRAKLGPCDILINGAGGNSPKATTTKEYLFPEDFENSDPEIKTFFDIGAEDLRFVLDLNLNGTLLPTQVFAADMNGREGCTVINISSMNAFRPLTKIPAYSAAKAAVSNFTQWLAVHFAPAGIRVNAIAPGFFITKQNEALLLKPDGSRTPRAEKIVSHTPQNRFGTPGDLTGTLLWLADPGASGFVNGVVVPVDGGFAAYSGV